MEGKQILLKIFQKYAEWAARKNARKKRIFYELSMLHADTRSNYRDWNIFLLIVKINEIEFIK